MKIGDFGLATVGIIQNTSATAEAVQQLQQQEVDRDVASGSELTGDALLTGKVGTALYVSPEIMNASKKLQYGQVKDHSSNEFISSKRK